MSRGWCHCCRIVTVKSTSSVFEHVYSSIVEGEQDFGDGFLEFMELVVV